MSSSFNPEKLSELPIDMLDEKSIAMPPIAQLKLRPAMHMADCCMYKYLPIKDTTMYVSVGLAPLLYIDPEFLDYFSYCVLILSPIELTKEDAEHALAAVRDEIQWEAGMLAPDTELHSRLLQLDPESGVVVDSKMLVSKDKYPFQYSGHFFIKPHQLAFDAALHIIREQAAAIERMDELLKMTAEAKSQLN